MSWYIIEMTLQILARKNELTNLSVCNGLNHITLMLHTHVVWIVHHLVLIEGTLCGSLH